MKTVVIENTCYIYFITNMNMHEYNLYRMTDIYVFEALAKYV